MTEQTCCHHQDKDYSFYFKSSTSFLHSGYIIAEINTYPCLKNEKYMENKYIHVYSIII